MANKPRRDAQRPAANRPPAMQGGSRRTPRVIEAPSFIERFRNRIIAGVGAVVLLVVVLIVVFKATGSGSGSTGSTVAQPAAAGGGTALVTAIAALPTTTFDAVGTGSYTGGIQPPPSQAQPLSENGKPDVFYFGAEWCPYCAAQRWAFTAALTRFGAFDNVGLVRSDPRDVFPNTATLSFNGSSYSSQYVAFSPVEAQNAKRQPLQTPSSAQSQILQLFDAGLNFPFVDFGNVYLANGASYDPGILKGMSQQQIVDALKDPTSDQAKGILGTANVMSAAICRLTNNQPVSVCSSPGVQAGAAKLGK